MKNIIFLSLTLIILSCTSASSQKEKDAETPVTCTDWECLEKNKNKETTVIGLLRKYTPNEKGKGAGHMFWDWELFLNDSNAVPVQAKDIDLSKFADRNVTVKCLVFYGIIIGSDEPHAQNAAGYRLDVLSIAEK